MSMPPLCFSRLAVHDRENSFTPGFKIAGWTGSYKGDDYGNSWDYLPLPRGMVRVGSSDHVMTRAEFMIIIATDAAEVFEQTMAREAP